MTSPRDILTVAEMAEADRSTIAAGTPGIELMRRAGVAIADTIAEQWSPRPVVVLCGPGNNGGDGFVAAKALAERGWSVRVCLLGDRAKLKGDAALAAEAWTGPVESLSPASVNGAGLVIDALFGAGLSKPLAPAVVEALTAAEASGAPIVAADLPSGQPGDAASPLGYAPRCALTVTFHRRKIAHALEPSRSLCGEVVVADIGLTSAPTKLFENGPELWLDRFPWPAFDAHKHERGRLIVVSGSMAATGAARMAARAALRIGAGLVTVLSPLDAVSVNAAHLSAVMVKPFAGDVELEVAGNAAEAAIIGPAAGVTPATALNVTALARTGAALVIDADALSVFRDEPERLFSALDRHDVLTPHPGEFERVFPGLLKSSPQRIAAAREAAARAGAVVLLKGPDTVIATPGGRCAVNMNGSPWLATAGSGDTLAGFIGGLLAQGMESFEAACAAAWIHAEAASLHGPGLIAEDLPELAPQVLGELWRMSGRA